jgi:hypothetical protein
LLNNQTNVNAAIIRPVSASNESNPELVPRKGYMSIRIIIPYTGRVRIIKSDTRAPKIKRGRRVSCIGS